MGQMGQNPMAQQMQAAIMAHIAEHVAFQYRNQIEERLGASLPVPNAELPEQVEVQLAKLVAQAAQQLTQIHQGEAAQQQAQQQAQDPIVQMQQQELQIKMKDTAIKEQKVRGDLAIRQQELQLKAQEAATRQGEDPAVAAAKAQQEMAIERQVHEQEMAQRQQEFDQKMAQKQREASMKMQTKLMELANKPAAESPEN